MNLKTRNKINHSTLCHHIEEEIYSMMKDNINNITYEKCEDMFTKVQKIYFPEFETLSMHVPAIDQADPAAYLQAIFFRNQQFEQFYRSGEIKGDKLLTIWHKFLKKKGLDRHLITVNISPINHILIRVDEE